MANNNELLKSTFTPAELEINNYDELKDLAKGYAERYKGLVFTRDSKAGANEARSELLKISNAIDDERKRVKAEYNKPLDEFENKVKYLKEIIDEPLEDIRKGLKEIDNQERAEREAALEDVLERLVFDTMITLDDVKRDDRWLNKGNWKDDLTPKPKFEAELENAVEQAEKDREHRETQKRVLEQYCKAQDIDPTGWVSQLEHRDAMEIIDLINLDIERKKKRQKEQEERNKEVDDFQQKQEDTLADAAEFAEQVPEEELIENIIKVTGSFEQLSALNEFLKGSGIKVEQVG